MRILKLLPAMLMAALLPLSANAAPLGADDFLPPVQADTPEAKKAATEVKQPDAVKQEAGIGNKQATVAATAQDAINTVVHKMEEVGGGCEQIKFPSGFGWVATGSDSYNVMPNKTATLTVQRVAYLKAYMRAKENLAKTLNEISTEGKENLLTEMRSIGQAGGQATNLGEVHTESTTEAVKGLIRGYAVYSVNDQQDEKQRSGTVTVSIVSTPKTLGKSGRVNSSAESAGSVREGLTHVLNEISSGLIPPVGGRAISVPKTGELAYVGFGSAVVVENSNPAVQTKLRLAATQQAQMRARNALCGIILGDDFSSVSKSYSDTASMSKEFEDMQKTDPVDQNTSETEIKRLAEQENSFQSQTGLSEKKTSLRKGVLPPGVTVKTFFNEDKTMATAVAIYMPSVTASATSFGQDMKNATIIPEKPQTGGGVPTLGTLDGKMDPSQQNAGEMPKQGPSGQVSKDADL